MNGYHILNDVSTADLMKTGHSYLFLRASTSLFEFLRVFLCSCNYFINCVVEVQWFK